MGAARALRVHVSTVSRRLDGLEATVGRRLFDRSRDGAHPTAAGERLVPFAEAMEAAALGAKAALEGFETTPEGRVRLSAPPGVADQLVAPAIGTLVRRHPGLLVELSADVDYADLARREADLVVRTHRPTAGDLVARRLATARYVVLGRGGAARTGPLCRPDQARWITWGSRLSHLPEARWLADRVPDACIVLASDSLSAMLEAARAGVGLLLAPEPFARHAGLACVPVGPPLCHALMEIPPVTLHVVVHRALRDVPRIAAVWRWLVETFGDEPNGT